MSIHQAFERLAKRSLPSEFIPVLAQDEDNDVFLCDNGHIGVCYIGDPMIGADDTTTEMLKGAFSLPMPDGAFIQISLVGMPAVDNYLHAYRERRENGLKMIRDDGCRDFLREYAEKRADFFKQGTEESLIPSTGVKVLDRKVIISVKIPYSGLQPSEEEVDLIAETGAKLAESLQALGLYVIRAKAIDYVRLVRRLIHPYEEYPYFNLTDEKLLRDQVFSNGETIDVAKEHLIVNDDIYVKALSVSRWPKRNALSLMAYMIGDPMGANNQIKLPYHINLTLHYPNQFSKTSAMRKKSGLINYQAFGPMLRWVPRLGMKKNGMDILINAIEQGSTVCESSLTIFLYSKDRIEASRQASAIKTYMQSFDLTFGEESRVMLPVFWNAFPLFPTAESIKNTFRFSTMAVEHALTFAPILGEWKGSSSLRGGGFSMLLMSRRGQIMPVDVYDSPTNYNSVVFAESGAGKSFFTQQMIMDYLSIGAKVWVIDVGRSYYKLAKVLNGSFIEFGEKSGICLNPFSHVENIDEEVGLLQTLVEKMAAPEDGLDDYRRSRIEEAIKAVWGRLGRSATITDLADYMSNQTDPRVGDIGSQLFTFTRYGSLGYWFDGENNVDLGKDLVVLEMEELKGKKTLQQVVLMQLIASIQREMYLSKDGRPKILVIDEAWDLLDDPIVGRFMEHAYRRFRKYGGAASIITQSIADLYKSPSGQAIANNSAYKFILRQNAESIMHVEKNGYLAIGDFGFYMMRTVHSVPGKYSEIMIYGPNGGLGVSRLVVDRFSQVLFSTAPAERTQILNDIENGMPALDSINRFIEING